MASTLWWFVLTVNPDGKAHKPELKSGPRLPHGRKMDTGTIVAEIVAGKKKTVSPQEINELAFVDRSSAVGFWEVVSKIILLPKKASPHDAREQQLQDTAPATTEKVTASVAPRSAPPTQSWIVYFTCEANGKLQPKPVTELGKDVLQVVEDDIACAEAGTFPSGRLLKIAFVDNEQRKRFEAAYKTGRANKKK